MLKKRLIWRLTPILALMVAMAAMVAGPRLAGLGVALAVIEFVILIGAVFASVHHADVIAHRTGEPYGTLILTVAVTVIEVALILSIMLAGKGRPELARETVFS